MHSYPEHQQLQDQRKFVLRDAMRGNDDEATHCVVFTVDQYKYKGSSPKTDGQYFKVREKKNVGKPRPNLDLTKKSQ